MIHIISLLGISLYIIIMSDEEMADEDVKVRVVLELKYI